MSADFPKDRLDWMDTAKGIGIVLVVYGHVARGLSSAGLASGVGWVEWFDGLIYSFHMPLFFMLSGYLLPPSLSKKGGASYLAGRLDVIVYPYVIWSLLQGGVEVVMSNWTNGKTEIASVLGLLWAPRAQFWFLYVLFIVTVISVLAMRKNPRVAAVILLFSSLLAYHYSPEIPSWIFRKFFENWVYFSAGICLWLLGFRQLRVSSWFLLIWSVCLFVALIYLFGLIGGENILVATIGISLVISISTLVSMGSCAAVASIGRASMVVYLVHILVASGGRIVLSKVFGLHDFYVNALVGVVFGVGVPWILWRFSEKFGIGFLFAMPVAWKNYFFGQAVGRRA